MNLVFLPKEHEYYADGRRIFGVTEALHACGLIDDRWYTTEGRQRGQDVHAATHYYDEVDLRWASVSEECKPFVEAWAKFREQSGFRPLAIEVKRAHPTWLFAGRVDRVGMFPKDRHMSIVDIKTGDPQEWVRWQTAAYALLWATVSPLPLRRFTVRLRGDGYYRLVEHALSDLMRDQEDFKAILRVAQIRGGIRCKLL